MEDLLIQISKDATNAKLHGLSQSATEAYGSFYYNRTNLFGHLLSPITNLIFKFKKCMNLIYFFSIFRKTTRNIA